MERHYVDSSMAISIGYDPTTSILEIEFKPGEEWQYHDVPENVCFELIRGSIGKYFQANIKGEYDELRVHSKAD